MAARDTVLVTGATGTVGRALVAELVDTDVQLRALSRDPAAIVPAGAQLVVGDFTDGYNDRAQPFVWTKTAEQVLDKAVKRQDTSAALH